MKSCPFCGSVNLEVKVRTTEFGQGQSVYCLPCGAIGPIVVFGMKGAEFVDERTLATWNERKGEKVLA